MCSRSSRRQPACWWLVQSPMPRTGKRSLPGGNSTMSVTEPGISRGGQRGLVCVGWLVTRMEHGRRPRPQPGSAAIPESGPFCSAVDFDERNDRDCNVSAHQRRVWLSSLISQPNGCDTVHLCPLITQMPPQEDGPLPARSGRSRRLAQCPLSTHCGRSIRSVPSTSPSSAKGDRAQSPVLQKPFSYSIPNQR